MTITALAASMREAATRLDSEGRHATIVGRPELAQERWAAARQLRGFADEAERMAA